MAIDLDKLALLIEARPVIWDNKAYGKCRKGAKEAWQEVYCGMFAGFLSLDSQKQYDIGKNITTKWVSSRTVWVKDLRKRQESNKTEPDPQPRPGSNEAIRYERWKFLRKVYCRVVDQSEPNLFGDFLHLEMPSGELDDLSTIASIEPPEDPEEDSLPPFSSPIDKEPTEHVEKLPETTTSPSQNIVTESHESSLKISDKHKLDCTNQQLNKKIKLETFVRPEIKSSPSKSFVSKDASEMEPGTSESFNNARLNITSELKNDIVEQLARPVTEQEDQPTSSNEICVEGSPTENKSEATTTQDILENDRSNLVRILTTEINGFDRWQYLTFIEHVFRLIRKIKYPNRE